MANTTEYRICPDSGLQFHKPAETLMKANAVAAVVFLLIGGILALLVTLTRWPAVHLLPADMFYQALTAHGLNMLIFWIIFFEIAILYFCSSTLLRCRLATPRWAWLGFALMLIGAVTTNVAILRGRSSVMLAYPAKYPDDKAAIDERLDRIDSAVDYVQHRSQDIERKLADVTEQPGLPGSRLLHGSVDATQKGFWNLYGFGQRTLVQLLDETLIQSIENSTDRTLNAARPMPAEVRSARRQAPADPERR